MHMIKSAIIKECSGSGGLRVRVRRPTWTFTLVEKEETAAASSGLSSTAASKFSTGPTGRGRVTKQRMIGRLGQRRSRWTG